MTNVGMKKLYDKRKIVELYVFFNQADIRDVRKSILTFSQKLQIFNPLYYYNYVKLQIVILRSHINS